MLLRTPMLPKQVTERSSSCLYKSDMLCESGGRVFEVNYCAHSNVSHRSVPSRLRSLRPRPGTGPGPGSRKSRDRTTRPCDDREVDTAAETRTHRRPRQYVYPRRAV